jgi:hypothetical protein
MTPKEKASELIEKMSKRIILDGLYDAKSCAIVSVNEIIFVLKNLDNKWHDSEDNPLTSMFNYEIEYWEDVISEISEL